jgi:RNA polymerase sigma factor (TIGR02999 family)
MSEVTRILSAIEQGDPSAAEQLLPLVYDELRKLAAAKLAQEKPGHTLQATALVHEAYLRLVGTEGASASRRPHWDGRGHFFAAAAEAMRRILIDTARGKAARKRGGAWRRMDLNRIDLATRAAPEDLLLLDDTLEVLARHDPEAAQLVKLRYYGGVSIEQAAELLGLSRSTAYERWTYARAWLYSELQDQSPEQSG